MLPRVSDIEWMAMTIKMEAGGECYPGKVAVAYVIRNRSSKTGKSISDVVLDPWDFSAWNTDSRGRLNLDDPDHAPVWWDCYKAACSAYFQLEEDPTNGATHYLNVELTKKLRGGSLPNWYSEEKVTVVIGLHTFLKLF